MYGKLFWKRWNVLVSLIKKNNFKKIVEVGVFNGTTSYHLAKKCKGIKLYCVDGYTNIKSMPASLDKAKERARNALNGFDNVQIIYKNSPSATKQFEDGSLDLVFI